MLCINCEFRPLADLGIDDGGLHAVDQTAATDALGSVTLDPFT
jgi:hypothetical protein